MIIANVTFIFICTIFSTVEGTLAEYISTIPKDYDVCAGRTGLVRFPVSLNNGMETWIVKKLILSNKSEYSNNEPSCLFNGYAADKCDGLAYIMQNANAQGTVITVDEIGLHKRMEPKYNEPVFRNTKTTLEFGDEKYSIFKNVHKESYVIPNFNQNQAFRSEPTGEEIKLEEVPFLLISTDEFSSYAMYIKCWEDKTRAPLVWIAVPESKISDSLEPHMKEINAALKRNGINNVKLLVDIPFNFPSNWKNMRV